ncbi:MAG: acyltransferase family protein [Eubacteriales bacterium]|nr:acyltransferase family protein [Eubacteriales bacterium]
MQQKRGTPRDTALDITRLVAFALVPSVHFFLNAGFYSTPVSGARMYLMVFMRTFFMTCVPLFLLLTGYLMSGRQFTADKASLGPYCRKISKTLTTYVLSTLLIVLFQKLYLGYAVTLPSTVFNITNFQQYAWYVNMYIGLYLLTPFLNILWAAIGSKEGHRLLVGVLAVLAVAPTFFNVYDFTTPGALADPALSQVYQKLVPDWWFSLYPVLYYFLGAYIRSHVDMKKLRTWALLLALCCCVACFGVYNIWRCRGSVFPWGQWTEWGSYQNVIDSVLLFLLINSIDFSRIRGRLAAFLGTLSGISFGAYLLSWIPDNFVYPLLMARFASIQERLPYFVPVVGFVIVVSLVLAFLTEQLRLLGARACGALIRAAKK